jgi:phospholipid/cholesterol/gamma-HCH transport system permease protein
MHTSHPSLFIGPDEIVHIEGPWVVRRLDELEAHLSAVSWPEQHNLVFEACNITAMDTGGAVLLQHTIQRLRQKGLHVEVNGLRSEFEQLIEMVSLNWDRVEPVGMVPKPIWLEQLGRFALERLRQVSRALAFLGETAVVMQHLLRSPRSVRWRALLSSLQLDGFSALPIIGLLTFLMGVVISYQGAEQLRSVGANIFVVDLVGISLLREIAPLVTAILVAGRSGSAYTAQIGTMRVTEELDALRTFGLEPMPFLVIPRTLALIIAMPLLTVFADIVGVFGGMLIAASQLGVTFYEFIARFDEAVALKHFVIGMGKAPVFAIIISLVGCYQGFQIRGGVDDVGRRTTISVVQSIFLVIVFDALFSIVLSWWKL